MSCNSVSYRVLVQVGRRVSSVLVIAPFCQVFTFFRSTCNVFIHNAFSCWFLAKRGRRPRVAGFIILSLKGLRRDEISCGVYGHIYLFIYWFIYLFICEVGVCRKWRHTAVRSWPNGVRRIKNSDLRAGGSNPARCFFFSSFFFSFFFFVSNPEPFLEPFLFFVFLFGLK